LRLLEREGDAKKLLDGEDWSAVNDDFSISVAAVRNDVDGVVALLERIGPNGRPNAEDYRTWSVFRGMRNHPRFKAAFSKAFGVPVVYSEAAELTLQATTATQLSEGEEAQVTKH
jgi:hypothetical protein